MLDQSFSAHNFDIIYGIESRKGNIDIHSMPTKYLDIVKKTKDIKSIIKELKNKEDDKSIEDLHHNKELLLELQENKKQALYEHLEEISDIVNSSSFRFELKKLKIKGKEAFSIDTTKHQQFFAIKQLQYNLRNVFKVRQANRHQILSNIKIFLDSKIPVYVIRTDISGFYESIPQKSLIKSVVENSLLNYKSKSFIRGILREYETTKDKSLIPENYGVPRGIGISSYLSELYMRDLDKKLSSRKEIIYYARYVDDIFIILSSLPNGKTLQSYYDDIVALFNDYELTLKQPGIGNKCELIDMYSSLNLKLQKIEYLGYCIEIERINGKIDCKFRMKKEKFDNIKKKMDNAIKHFNDLSVINVKQAYRDLMDSLDYITGNIALNKTKSGVKTGLYYSNDLLDNDLPDLKGLTRYLHSRKVEPYNKLKGYEVLKSRIESKIKKIDLAKRWNERKFNRFSLEQIERMESWL